MSFLNWEGRLGVFIQRTDWLSPLILLVLATWSVLALFSSGSLKEPDFFAQDFSVKQTGYIAIGWMFYWVAALVDLKVYERFAWWLYTAGIVLLLPVAICAILKVDITGIIEPRLGARRWIFLPGFSVQPAEIAKTSTLVLLALMAGRGVVYGQLTRLEKWAARKLNQLLPAKLAGAMPRFLPLLVRMSWLVALPFVLIYVQPDLGSALTYIPMAFALLLIANVPLRFFAFLGVLALPLVVAFTVDMMQYGQALQKYQQTRVEGAAYKDAAVEIRGTYRGLLPIQNYQRERIMTLVAPRLIDPLGIGKDWQPRQARIAIARGGLSGQGYQNGTVARLGWLPEAAAHNDFLFSGIAEESGFIGGCSIIGLFGLLITLALRTAARARDRFGACLATGAAVFVAAHVIINIGMNVGIMPVTGVSLPFLSYGGSFVLSCFLLFGVVQSVHRSSRPIPLPACDTDPADLLAPSQLSGRVPV